MVNTQPALLENSAPEIAELLQQSRQRDAIAFDAICRTFEPRLLRQAMLLCGDLSMAEDLVQETLIEAWKCLSRYNGHCQFFTWLCAILHNRHRNACRRKRLWLIFGLHCSDTFEPDIDHSFVDQDRPDKAAEAQERAAQIRRCIQALPAKQQQVIYLRFFVDDSLEGIAVAMRCSVGTVKSRLFHALERLRCMSALREQCEPFRPPIDSYEALS